MLGKMRDYSGEFLPELKLEDFSADTLLGLVKLYSRLYMAVDGFWYLAVKERLGNDEALACDIRAWEMNAKYELTRVTRQLNIQGNDVVAFVKAVQLTPWFLNMEYEIEIENRSSAVLTVTHCPTLDALEKEGEGRENQICNIFEPTVFKSYASFFNPDAEVKCLKSPPRDNQGEICCQWQFTLGSQQ